MDDVPCANINVHSYLSTLERLRLCIQHLIWEVVIIFCLLLLFDENKVESESKGYSYYKAVTTKGYSYYMRKFRKFCGSRASSLV